jgi:hypothetical protein
MRNEWPFEKCPPAWSNRRLKGFYLRVLVEWNINDALVWIMSKMRQVGMESSEQFN